MTSSTFTLDSMLVVPLADEDDDDGAPHEKNAVLRRAKSLVPCSSIYCSLIVSSGDYAIYLIIELPPHLPMI